MTNGILLVKALDTPPSSPRPKFQKLKPRRERRQEMRDRAAKYGAN